MKKNILNFVFVGFLFIALIGLTGCSKDPIIPGLPEVDLGDLSASQNLKKFNNIEEFRDFMSQNADSNSYSGMTGGGMMMDSAVRVSAVAESSNAPSPSKVSGGADDYSQTNVQIQGVDEADFVKNDDRFIYVLSNNELVIIDGKDGTDSKILSSTKIPVKDDNYYSYNNIRDMFLYEDKVVIFVDAYEPAIYFNKYDIMPVEGSRQNTKVLVYDVSDKDDPELSEEYSLSGSYYSSRMIDDVVYAVTQEYLYDWRYYDGPMIAYAKTTLRPEIYYFDNPEDNYQMNLITSIDVDDKKVVDSMSLMLGYGNTLMVSEDNIYIAYQKQQRWCWGWRCSSYDDDARERFTEVVVPLLDKELKDEIQSILDKDLPEDEEWTKISEVLDEFFAKVMEDEELQEDYEDMFEDIEDALNEYDAKKALENSKTVIHRIAIDGGELTYATKGEVNGQLLNQFSMDEYDNNLRVATTINIWLRGEGRLQNNNVYVLNDDLDVIGELKGLAENESIYSTRFMGDKLYMVTFRQVDPFFVIDLSDPQNPEVLGYLKIPGYSSYLHPINDKYVIGVGKDTGENEWGGVTAKGVKISLFDVSDFENPKEIDKEIIGLEGSDTPILYDHRAFLYSSSRNMLVIPVTEVVDRIKSGYSYRTKIWYGAYVFEISEDGFEELGRIKHASSDTSYYYWYDASNVKRSLYMDNVLYTISDRYVKANDMDKDLEELNSIRLPLDSVDSIDKPMPVDIAMIE